MRLLPLILVSISVTSIAQSKRSCSCDNNSLMGSAISCNARILSDSSKLYWQFTCDRIWLTLEKRDRKKFIINEVPIDLYGYTYRLGYHLIKEYRNTLLFRSGCGATGPCSYFLVNKNDGLIVREFGQLICIDTDVLKDNPHDYNFEFVVYLSPNTDDLIVFFVNDGKILKIPFKENFVRVIPENQFTSMTLNNDQLRILYLDHYNKTRVININLKEK